MSCKHTYEFQGVVYSLGHQLPGSGAHEVIYEDRYYCTQCLDVVDKNPRVKGNSYEKRIVGSFPMNKEQYYDEQIAPKLFALAKINDVVDLMPPEQLDWAMQQVKASLDKMPNAGGQQEAACGRSAGPEC